MEKEGNIPRVSKKEIARRLFKPGAYFSATSVLAVLALTTGSAWFLAGAVLSCGLTAVAAARADKKSE